MKKILIFFVLSMFIISFTSAFSDQQIPQTCGGDSELIIGCLGDSQLVFLGGISSVSVGGLSTGIGPDSNNISSKTPVVVPKEAEQQKKPILLYLIIALILISLFFFVYKKRDKEKAKIKKDKNLNSSTT